MALVIKKIVNVENLAEPPAVNVKAPAFPTDLFFIYDDEAAKSHDRDLNYGIVIHGDKAVKHWRVVGYCPVVRPIEAKQGEYQGRITFNKGYNVEVYMHHYSPEECVNLNSDNRDAKINNLTKHNDYLQKRGAGERVNVEYLILKEKGIYKKIPDSLTNMLVNVQEIAKEADPLNHVVKKIEDGKKVKYVKEPLPALLENSDDVGKILKQAVEEINFGYIRKPAEEAVNGLPEPERSAQQRKPVITRRAPYSPSNPGKDSDIPRR